MARYFFHLHECGSVLEDEEGLELVDPGQIRVKALEIARSIICAEVQEGRLCLSCHIEVQDADQRPVVMVPFKLAVELSGIN